MSRLGPESIEPGSAPGGLVFRAYDQTGRLVLERAIPGIVQPGDVESLAVGDARFTRDAIPGNLVSLVTYDGDTGARVTSVSIVRRWAQSRCRAHLN